jgi:DNA-binding response OmpR family regulator
MLSNAPGQAPRPAPEVREDPEKHQPTVLVVEDDEKTLEAMTLILAQEGYLVLTAPTAHDAIATLRRPLSSIDVVVLDVNLPDVNGIDLCARLRESYPKLPVIVCSGAARPEEVARLLELGARRYFQKPISPEELLSTVEAALP